MDTKKLFNERRSVNYFDQSREIDMQTLEELINLAVLAPSAFNLQPWRIIAVKSAEEKEKLCNLSNGQEKVKEAPVSLILVGNKNAWNNDNPVWQEMLQSVGGDQGMVDGAKEAASFLYGSSEERKLKFAESNTGLLAMALMMAAKEFGIDTHPMSGIDFDGIKNGFGLSESETVVMLIAMGYHDERKKLYPRRPRRLFNEIVTTV